MAVIGSGDWRTLRRGESAALIGTGGRQLGGAQRSHCWCRRKGKGGPLVFLLAAAALCVLGLRGWNWASRKHWWPSWGGAVKHISAGAGSCSAVPEMGQKMFLFRCLLGGRLPWLNPKSLFCSNCKYERTRTQLGQEDIIFLSDKEQKCDKTRIT